MKHEAFGKYTLIDWVAAGGMGEVFLARAGSEGFVRLFAIKRILAQHAESDDFVRMMMNEARISILLTHPNIAQMFEFGQIGRHFFMALEYVEGLSLVSLLRRGRDKSLRMPAADAVAIAVQVCRALHYAHTKVDNSGVPLEIVHRDISPQNILIDETGGVKVIDFGIARASQSLVKTDADSIKGKIPYMSPEQAMGEALDGRSDLYALGVVLYEALTYEMMHRSKNALQTLKDVQAGTVPSLELHLGAGTPKSLIAVLEKTLQRNPDDRFASAADMERALALVLNELEPGHTAHRLAGIVNELDQARGDRKALIKTSVTGTFGPSSPSSAVSEENRPSPRARASDDPRAPGFGEAQTSGMDVDQLSLAGRVVEESTRAGIPSRREVSSPSSPSPPQPASSLSSLELAPPSARPLAVGLGLGLGAALLLGLLMVVVIVVLPATSEQAAGDHASPGASTSPSSPSTTTARATTRVVLVGSEPPGAVILIDGLWRGQTPAAISGLPLGAPVLVRLELEGYAPAELSLAPGSIAPASVRLARAEKVAPKMTATTKAKPAEPAARGCAAVTAAPWAYVSVAGNRIGITPLPCVDLPVGRHTLHLENPALGVSRDVDVIIAAGATVRVSHKW